MGLGFMNISYLAFLKFPDHMSEYLIVLRRAGIAFHLSLKFIPRCHAGMLAIGGGIVSWRDKCSGSCCERKRKVHPHHKCILVFEGVILRLLRRE